MMIPLLKEAVDALSALPSIGEKTALRLALFLLRRPEEEAVRLGNALIRLRTEVRNCSVCNMISEGDVCPICADSHRDHSVICVVESVRDVMSIEETGEYNGVYHVLGGVISPMEGETTSYYIKRLLSGKDVRISAIARGVGFGDDLEYTDSLTLGMSIKNRTPLR